MIFQEFDVSLALSEMEDFLLTLKQFLSNTHFPVQLDFDQMTAEIIRIFSQFFEGISLPMVKVRDSNAESLWVSFIIVTIRFSTHVHSLKQKNKRVERSLSCALGRGRTD